jgi:hypothetical protein
VRGLVREDGYGPQRPAFFARKFGPRSSALLELLDVQLAAQALAAAEI